MPFSSLSEKLGDKKDDELIVYKQVRNCKYFIQQLSNFKKDLRKIIEIFVNEIKNALKRHERIELRDVFSRPNYESEDSKKS